MLSSDKELQIIDYPVNKDYGEDEPFFRLITEGGEVQLPKLQFQKEQPLPDYLSCRIKGYNGRLPIVGHNMPRYVSEFYADGFSRQQEFEFRVISISDAAKGFYRLTDDNGLIFNLRETKTILARGQVVKCKFERLEANFFKLYRSTTDKQFPMLKLSQVANKLEIHGLNATKLENILAEIPEMKTALDEMNHGRPIWIITAIRAIRQCLPRLFSTAIERYSFDSIGETINGYERLLLFLLQGSEFLRNIKGNERTELQAEITGQIEQLDIYRQTLNIVATQSQHKFINGLLNNLKKSGYIYHPTTQFSIMMTLFRMSPELVNSSLRDIFDALMGWDLTTWKAEPFRQAFVEQLEIYIQDTRVEIDSFLQAETVADNEIIIRVLTAIAIQQSLSSESDSIDMRLNKSLFYRYLSVLKNAKAGVLLEKSYLSLMGASLPTDYIWSDIKEPTMMMTRASVDPPKNAAVPTNPLYFFSGDIEVEVGPEGITIAKTDDNAMNIVPNGMLAWPGLKVNVSSKALNRQKIRTLEGHSEFWTNIETSLFVPDVEVKSSLLDSQSKRTPYLDDIVRIEIDRVITNAADSNRIEGFECKIVDDHFVEGRGILPASNIVNYNLHGVTVGTFRHDDGRHMQFDAQVVDIDDNDTLIFSLEEPARQAIRDMANVGERCYCVVTKDNGRSYSAISENGFGLYVNKEDMSLPPFRKGNVISVTITGNNYGAIQSVVEDGPIDNFFFSNARALHNLLEAIAVNYDTGSEEMQFEEDDLISAEDLREIIEILRFKASSESDILSSYDYLSYARLLALIIGDEQLASILKAHKDILQLHQYYAKNKRIDIESIDKILSSSTESMYIRRMAARLQIVASLGHSEENSELWKLINSSGIDIEKELAQMVLSYNLLYDMNREDSTLAGIQDNIAKKLNVSSEQRDLKYYGAESQYVEFKSSLVYPARKGKSGLSVADPDRQEFEILHIIAGFLNSTGGTLYLGVNDDHYERGLEEDFTFYRMDNTERNTKFRRSIKSLDNYANYLQNLIDSSFSLGKNVGDYAKAYIDEESVKGVVAVKIDPCPHIVYLDNTIYVRHGGKTEPYTRLEEINLLKSDRLQLYNQLVSAAKDKGSANNDRHDSDSETTRQDKNPVPETLDTKNTQEEPPVETTSTNSFTVSTSEIRKNILHEYLDHDHFVTPKFYIRFVGDHDYVVTSDEWKIDEENDRLVIAVSEEETDGYLLLVYEGEYAVKVKMSELLEKNRDSVLSHYPDKKLVFASPVSANAGLYSLHSNAKNTLYERMTPIEKIAQGSIGTAPERIMDCGSINSLMWEIVKEENTRDFTDIISTEMKRTQIGSLVKGIPSSHVTKEDVRKALLKKLL